MATSDNHSLRYGNNHPGDTMNMHAFKPTRADGRSYRDVVLDEIKGLEPGDIVRYKQLGQILGPPYQGDNQRIAGVVRQALKPLLKLYKRGLENVPKIGYRVLKANEHITIANRYESKATRSLTRALDFYTGTNLSELTETERRLHNNQVVLAQALIASHRHLDKRLTKVEELLRGGRTIDGS